MKDYANELKCNEWKCKQALQLRYERQQMCAGKSKYKFYSQLNAEDNKKQISN